MEWLLAYKVPMRPGIARLDPAIPFSVEQKVRMKLRTLIFAALVLVSVLPVGLLALWHHKTVIDSEFSVVEDQHRVIAENLTIALERYATDLRSAFRLTTENLGHPHEFDGLQQHLSELYFHHVCSIDLNGNIQRLQCALACPQAERFNAAVLVSLQSSLQAAAKSHGEVVFSPMTRNPAGRPALYLVRKMSDDSFAIGEVGTDYFIELQAGRFLRRQGSRGDRRPDRACHRASAQGLDQGDEGLVRG